MPEMWNVSGHNAGSYGGGCASRVRGAEPVSKPRAKGRGRERSRSPLRNMSTSNGFEEPRQGLVQVIASTTQPDRSEVQYQLFRLKRKFEEVKKRYRQDKEVWVKEKEMLLREIAQIQTGENRRILLDLRTILEGVQVKVKKEEDQRAELQHQYSSDKYAWELERAELKCRIGQLEVKASKQYVEKTPQEAREAFGKEREEKQLLANIRSAAMDLRKQLEISERNWGREKMELLEQFDNERKEWESQLKDMQRKIEQIYWDVNSRQDGKLNGQRTEQRQRENTRDDWVLLNLHASSSECNEQHDEKDQNCMNNTRAHGAGMEDVLNDSDQGIGNSATVPLFIEELSLESLEEDGSSQNLRNIQNDKKKFSSALNAALQEIAKVSEELCSYQKDVQKKVSHRRTKSVSYLQECKEKQNENTLLRNESSWDENSCVSNDILKALSPTLSEYQKCPEELHNEKNWSHSSRDRHGISPGNSGGDGLNVASSSRRKAPPVPPRTSSWYLANSFLTFPLDQEDAVKEDNSDYTTQNHIEEKSYNCPYVLRKCEASLQENEQKSFIGGRHFETLAAQIKCDMEPKCNKNNNHSRWSSDVTKLGFGTGNNYFGSAVKTFSSDNNIMFPTQQQSLDGNSNSGLRQTKPLSPKCNLTECNFASSSSTTGVCSTSSVFVQSTLDVPSTQTGTFRKAALKTESYDPVVYGKSVELAQIEAGSSYPRSNFSFRSAGNVHATKQFSSKHTGSAFRPYVSPYLTNTNIAGQDKQSSGYPSWMTDNDKSKMFDKVDLIPNNFSKPKPSSYAKSNFDLVRTILRNNERPASPSFHVKKKVANCADGRTKPQTSHSGSLHENPNKITHLFQILHLDQEKPEVRKKSGPSRCVSGQQASLPVTLPTLTMSLNGMSFSRPARPQNRRLPSRWATRSSSAPAVHNRAAQKCEQAFIFNIKTSVI
ncbi:uncharacterized protein KIAA0408-like isoform X1 [Carcharodon carcharias]|uniref:uncharacterized protein KIAA0408-like isoform X1 n=1 Tax=Carcharodon carcharias TaxID=13397 RepID=UPI001B7E4277|nr:uncharacterized protein KIAA0408-like isoform X1 [Carcharodon carcharias]